MSDLGSLIVGKPQFLDNSGAPLNGGKLNAYEAGTTTRQDTYSDSSLSTANTNPVVLDSAGRASIFLKNAAYKFVLTDSSDVTIWTVDNYYPPSYVATQAVDPTIVTTTSTGTQNNFAPGIAGSAAPLTILRCNNSALLTITGFDDGVDGQRLQLVSIGTGQVDLAHQNTGSDAANRLINFATSRDTPLAAGVGTAEYVYDGTTDRWRLVQHEQGAYVSIPFSAGNYTGTGSMTWTVSGSNQKTLAYYLHGRSVKIIASIEATSVGGTLSSGLQITVPFTSSAIVSTGAFIIDNSVGSAANVGVASGGTGIVFGKVTGNMSTASGTTYVYGEIEVPVQ